MPCRVADYLLRYAYADAIIIDMLRYAYLRRFRYASYAMRYAMPLRYALRAAALRPSRHAARRHIDITTPHYADTPHATDFFAITPSIFMIRHMPRFFSCRFFFFFLIFRYDCFLRHAFAEDYAPATCRPVAAAAFAIIVYAMPFSTAHYERCYMR